MDEDEVIKSCTRLLEKGCTMLATHHDCGAPLFRCQGEVVCPVCSFQSLQPSADDRVQPPGRAESRGLSLGDVQSEPKEADVPIAPGPEDKGLHAERSHAEWVQAEEHLRETVLRKLKQLTMDLSEEEDLGKMKRQLDCIEGLLKILQTISR